MKYKPIKIDRLIQGLHTNRETLLQQNSEFFHVPSAHEIFVRNRIPRGAHYDPADDGPETQIIAREMRIRVEEFFDSLPVATWLSPRVSWPVDGPVDILEHRRE